MKTAVALGARRELFVDDWLIQSLDGCRLRLAAPIPREIVWQAQPPIETAVSGCYNFVHDGDRILMYHRGFYPIGTGAGDTDTSQTTHLALSRDGIHFERPAFGFVEFEGSANNNIIWRGYQSHNFVAFRDDNPAALPEERFKAVGGGWQALFGLTSPDGIHWRLIQEQPLAIKGGFDSVNVPFWDRTTQRYRLFSRYWDSVNECRAIQSCESEDFLRWTEPVPHQYAAGVPREHFYTNATVPCPGAEHLLLSFPKRFVPERTLDTTGMAYPADGLSDAVFMTSRDGVHWDRPFLEAWLRPGPDPRNWSHRSLMPAVGILETAPGEWSLYVSEHYGWDDNRLRRFTVGAHRLASIHAGAASGTFTTRPVTFVGDELRINAATAATGSVRIELQDATGQPLPGFGLNDMSPWFGDAFDMPVRWENGGNLARLAGRPIRLRFSLQDADVYALRFAPMCR